MDLILLAVKADLNNVLNVGQYMLLSLFGVAVFMNFLNILKYHINWADVILRLVVGLVLIQNYPWVMDTTRNIVVGVDEMVNPNHDFVSQYSLMSQNMQKEHEKTTIQSVVSNFTPGGFVRNILRNWIINFSFMFYAIISKVMEAVRYCLVVILYKLGPVLIPLILFQSTASVVKGWFTSYVSALCWPILWHLILGIAVILGQQAGSSWQGLEQFACLNFAICFVLIFSPFIINSLAAGVGTGSSAAMAGVMSSSAVTKFVTKMGSAGIAAGGMAALGGRTPTTSSGRFRDTMLGDDKEDRS